MQTSDLISWLRQSTTGQGIAGMVATAAAAFAARYTTDPQMIGLAFTLAGAAVLIVFPQATPASKASAAVAIDVEKLLTAVRDGRSAMVTAAINLPAAPSPAPVVVIQPTAKPAA